MHEKIRSFLANIDRRDGEGIGLYDLEISNALNICGANRLIVQHLDAGFEIIECTRVVFSNKISWIDVLLALKNQESGEVRNLIITYEASQNQLVAVAATDHEFSRLDSSSSHLPFALCTLSHATDVTVTEKNMAGLNTRREAFAKAVGVALLPFMGLVTPAHARPTSYTTNATTQNSKSTQTPTSTTGVTTRGGDNDTKTDTQIDRTTDNSNDPRPDSRDDP